jgi:soluble lytic murein transglycosylase-like protein
MYILYTHLQERAYFSFKGRVTGLSFAEMAHWIFPFLLIALLTYPTLQQYQSYTITEQYEVVLEPEKISLPSAPLFIPKAEPERTSPPVQEEEQLSPIDKIIFSASSLYEVDPALIKAIIMAESGFNPKAVSHRGAKGLMQLMPATARSLGVEDIFDPEHNIRGGVQYFKSLLKRYKGNVRLSLAAYNAGIRKVREYKGIPPFKATKSYIEKVLKYYSIYKEENKGVPTFS